MEVNTRGSLVVFIRAKFLLDAVFVGLLFEHSLRELQLVSHHFHMASGLQKILTPRNVITLADGSFDPNQPRIWPRSIMPTNQRVQSQQLSQTMVMGRPSAEVTVSKTTERPSTL